MLRQAEQKDIASIQRVRHSIRENRLVSTTISDSYVLEAIEIMGRGWVIETKNKIVAFAVGNSQTGNVWALFVDPNYEGRGYGRQLHDVTVDWLFSQGLKILWLSTEPDTRAEQFYTKAGWTNAGLTESGEIRFEMKRI